jgi:hypothetical protein
MSWTVPLLAGFQVTINGRFWVTPEVATERFDTQLQVTPNWRVKRLSYSSLAEEQETHQELCRH